MQNLIFMKAIMHKMDIVGCHRLMSIVVEIDQSDCVSKVFRERPTLKDGKHCSRKYQNS